MESTTPVACTLSTEGFSERMIWIAALNRDALESHARDDRRLTLRYARSAESRVRELVRRERECCGFLTFDVRVLATQVEVTIDAPVSAEGSAQALFTQFTARTPSGDGCACATVAEMENAHSQHGQAARVAATSSAAAAIACGVCCVVPFVFPAVAMTTVGAGIAAFAGMYWWAMRAAFGAVIVGWLWLAWAGFRDRRRPGRSTWRSMSGATLVVLLAYGWSVLEPHVITVLKR